MAKGRKNAKGSGDVNVAATNVAKKSTTTSNSVVVALNYPTQIRFDLAGGKVVRLNGNAEFLRGKEQGTLPVGGFGLTTISKAEWEEIQKKYGSMKIFKSHLCFAANSENDATAETKELKELRHGREPAAVRMEQTEAAQSAE